MKKVKPIIAWAIVNQQDNEYWGVVPVGFHKNYNKDTLISYGMFAFKKDALAYRKIGWSDNKMRSTQKIIKVKITPLN